jgi:hypothetical protein
MRLFATLILACALLIFIAHHRPPEYDEAYSIFLTAGDPRPAWPTSIFTPAQVQNRFTGTSSLAGIARNLRTLDVHPPLYFWALEYWRRIVGPSWFSARLLSVLFATASLGLLALIARAEKIPVIPTILICLLSYGFAYTSCVARGFALAQLLNLLGLALILETRHGRARPGHPQLFCFLSGLAFSAASFTNDLAIFTALGTLATETIKPRHPSGAFPTALRAAGTFRPFAREGGHPRLPYFLLGLATFLPAGLYFFSAQHASRPGQFTEFSLPHALALLAKDQAAALYGGLPLYAGPFAPIIFAGLAILSLFIIIAFIKRPSHTLFIAAATPAGLLALGLIFRNTPIEIRYCAFSLPYLALALSQALPSTTRSILITTQVLAIAGLALAPATMQPQGLAARAIPVNAVAIIPIGNDGVGIPGPFIAAAASSQKIQIIPGTTLPPLAANQRYSLAALAIDNESNAALPTIISELSSACRQISATRLVLTYAECRPHQQP